MRRAIGGTMYPLRKRATVAALVVALAVTPILSGCSLQGIVQGATGGKVDLGGASMPAGFPSEVPVISGDVQFGGSVGDDSGRVYNVTIKAGGGSPIDAIKSQLEGAGFTNQTDIGGVTSDGGTLIYTSDAWGVLVVVGKDGSDWIASYTVTTADKGN